jgi:uncharacterized membrane protein (DUF441 family)
MTLIKQLLSSKKAIAAVTGVLVSVVGRWGLDLPADAVTQIVAVICSFILGQGVADAGKEAVRLQNAADAGPRT